MAVSEVLVGRMGCELVDTSNGNATQGVKREKRRKRIIRKLGRLANNMVKKAMVDDGRRKQFFETSCRIPFKRGQRSAHHVMHTATMANQKEPLLPHQSDESLLEPFHYVSSVPGKDVRGKLIDCFQLWFQVESHETLAAIQQIVGELHNASLLIDDIEDNSRLRRGIPVAHKIFGVPTVINCANYVYFLAMEKCHALNNASAMQVFLGEILNLHRGQGLDIAWRESLNCPSEEEYLAMVRDKTGGLFRLAVGLLQAFASSHATTDFTGLVNRLAEYFQIRDDYINLADDEYMKSKSFCEDLTEGKFSFPIIHAIHANQADTRLLSILKQRTEDVDVKRYAQKLMKEAGSLSYTRQRCSALKEAIVEDIVGFGGNEPLLKLISLLDLQLDKIDSEETSEKDRKGLEIDMA